ncbi:MAG: hypothetical protein GXO75_16205 [Calditrichaeota bacterium]|nr:hypothetical protein [Calditrichota bacterium]
MKKLILFLILVFAVSSFAQVGVFGTATAKRDTVWLISSAADSVTGRWIMYEGNTWRDKEGMASLFAGVYSADDTIRSTITIKYQLLQSISNLGDSLVTSWYTLDSLTQSDVSSVAPGAGTFQGKEIDMADAASTNSTPWQVHQGIRFRFVWTPTVLDTAILYSRFSHPHKEK